MCSKGIVIQRYWMVYREDSIMEKKNLPLQFPQKRDIPHVTEPGVGRGPHILGRRQDQE